MARDIDMIHNDLDTMAQTASDKKDHWSADAYQNAASFVPRLTTTVIKYLDAQPDDQILDIGCGDGVLTQRIATSLVGKGHILGLDASKSFIESAQSKNKRSNASYQLQDCTELEKCAAIDGSYDKVFSNAALHWILRQESTRISTIEYIYKALKPGGKFVFEYGGKGNVGEVQAALTAVLMEHGVSLSKVREVNPWYFPTTAWMEKVLKNTGFSVDICELEYRPTKMTDASESATSTGLEGWMWLMAAQYLEAVESSKREGVVKRVCEVLDDIVSREDGSKWIGNVRLRGVATKPSQ